MRTNNKGFTLIELLVVIAIIGLLSTLAVVSLNNARQRSRDAKRVSDIKQVQTALELHFIDNDGYPGSAASTTYLGIADGAAVTNGAGAGTAGADAIALDSSVDGFAATCGASETCYMGAVPSNPSPNGIDYEYVSATDSSSYTIYFHLEGATGQLGAGAHTADEAGIN